MLEVEKVSNKNLHINFFIFLNNLDTTITFLVTRVWDWLLIFLGSQRLKEIDYKI